MKQTIRLLSLLILVAGCLHGQDQFLWLRLSENRVITNAKFQTVVGETLIVVRAARITQVPLGDIVQLRVMNSSSMLEGVAIGAGTGLALGGLIGFSLQAMDKPGLPPVTTMVSLSLIGGIIGGTMAALEKPGDVVDMAGKSVEEKRDIIRALVARSVPEKH